MLKKRWNTDRSQSGKTYLVALSISALYLSSHSYTCSSLLCPSKMVWPHHGCAADSSCSSFPSEASCIFPSLSRRSSIAHFYLDGRKLATANTWPMCSRFNSFIARHIRSLMWSSAGILCHLREGRVQRAVLRSTVMKVSSRLKIATARHVELLNNVL